LQAYHLEPINVIVFLLDLPHLAQEGVVLAPNQIAACFLWPGLLLCRSLHSCSCRFSSLPLSL